MDNPKNTIMLTLIFKGETHRLQTYPNQYYSLMTLIADNLAVPGFGLCCGMGSCVTCMVQVSYAGSPVKRTALACDVVINDAIANSTIFIPDRAY